MTKVAFGLDWDNFDSEEQLVAAIKQHLLAEEQRKWLFDEDLSIEDLLNGRFECVGDREALVDQMYADWNERLGFHAFGY